MGTRPHRARRVRRSVIRAVAVAVVAGLGTLAPADGARAGEVYWDGGAATSNWGDVANMWRTTEDITNTWDSGQTNGYPMGIQNIVNVTVP